MRVADEILKMKYHHVVRRWSVPGSGEGCTMLCFEKLLILCEGNLLSVVDEETNEVSTQKLEFWAKGMVHPVTYVNKLVAYSHNKVVLLNALAGKTLYQFAKFEQMLEDSALEIEGIEASPLVDIVAVALSNGSVAFLNLRKDQVVFSVRQKLPVKAMAFSGEAPWLATGDA